MGWTPLLLSVSCLSLGVKLFLYCGSAYHEQNNRNFWDILSESKASYIFRVSSGLDNMEKKGIVPSPDSKFEHLKVFGIGSCPIKRHNVNYIRKFISKSTFIGNIYGATEFVGAISGLYASLPCYSLEIQLPALGTDLRCYNERGEDVVGELGDVVIATPVPSLPVHLWKDKDNTILRSTYLSRYPGVWCQNDLCWVNPETMGIEIKGRSDDTFLQNGDRFGSADIYFAIHDIEELEDYICAGVSRQDGDQCVVLFVKMRNGYQFTPAFRKKVEQKIEEKLFRDCIPKLILEAKDIPYNLNNKRMESTVGKILATNEIPETINIRNPECLKYFCNIPEISKYKNMIWDCDK